MPTKKEMIEAGWKEHKDFWSKRGEFGTMISTKRGLKEINKKQKIKRIKIASIKPDIFITRKSMTEHLLIANKVNNNPNRNPERFFPYAMNHYYGWCFDGVDGIVVNLKDIHEGVLGRNLSTGRNFNFYQCVAETLMHEFMHKLLEKTEGIPVSGKYDNIKDSLRKFGVMA